MIKLILDLLKNFTRYIGIFYYDYKCTILYRRIHPQYNKKYNDTKEQNEGKPDIPSEFLANVSTTQAQHDVVKLCLHAMFE